MSSNAMTVVGLVMIVILASAGGYIIYNWTQGLEDEDDVNGEDGENGSGNGDQNPGGGGSTTTPRPTAVILVNGVMVEDRVEIRQYEEVSYDGSLSVDPAGEGLEFAWDIDGDFREDIFEPNTTYTYDVSLTIMVTLWVEDVNSRTDSEYIHVQILPSPGPPVEEVITDEGNNGTLVILPHPLDLFSNNVVHHWNMTANVSRMRMSLFWDAEGWDLGLETGTGSGPDEGIVVTKKSSTSGNITINFENRNGSFLQEGSWFTNIIPNDEEDHIGDSLDYILRITLFRDYD